MYEDWQCDENFRVESTGDFFGGLSPDEQEFALCTMKPCGNCGEMRPKTDPSMKKNGVCHLCSISDDHTQRRGTSQTANKNGAFLAQLSDKLQDQIDELTELRQDTDD
jgi:hypothetical protein